MSPIVRAQTGACTNPPSSLPTPAKRAKVSASTSPPPRPHHQNPPPRSTSTPSTSASPSLSPPHDLPPPRTALPVSRIAFPFSSSLLRLSLLVPYRRLFFLLRIASSLRFASHHIPGPTIAIGYTATDIPTQDHLSSSRRRFSTSFSFSCPTLRPLVVVSSALGLIVGIEGFGFRIQAIKGWKEGKEGGGKARGGLQGRTRRSLSGSIVIGKPRL